MVVSIHQRITVSNSKTISKSKDHLRIKIDFISWFSTLRSWLIKNWKPRIRVTHTSFDFMDKSYCVYLWKVKYAFVKKNMTMSCAGNEFKVICKEFRFHESYPNINDVWIVIWWDTLSPMKTIRKETLMESYTYLKSIHRPPFWIMPKH